MGVYRLEMAPTGRASCSNTECKSNGIKIGKGELRFGSQYTVKEVTAWKWKHWGCVTPKQISNLEDTIEGNLDFLDGYDEIDEESQAKVRKALEDGHVADDEWKGDMEMNRPGANGFRSPATKKAMKDARKAEEDDADEAASPTKPASKKRSRAKGNNNDEAPPSTKVKGARKKTQKDRGDEEEEKGIAKSVTSEAEAPAQSNLKTTKNATRGKKLIALELNEEATGSNGHFNGQGRPGKRGPPRKAKKQINEDEDSKVQRDAHNEEGNKLVETSRPRKRRNVQ